jgi:hypothetical protein
MIWSVLDWPISRRPLWTRQYGRVRPGGQKRQLHVMTNIIELHKIRSKCDKQFCTCQICSLDPSNPSLSIEAGMTLKSPVWDLFFCNKTPYKTDKSHCNAWCIRCLKLAKKHLRDADEEAICAGLLGEGRTEDELHNMGQTSRNKSSYGSLPKSNQH